MESEKFDARFTFVNGVEREQLKTPTKKPVGYFRDAFSRFAKNKASFVALIIIILIALFSLLTPLFTTQFSAAFMDTHYAKKTARNLTLKEFGIADGGVVEELNERAFVNVLGIGIGAATDEGEDYFNGIDLSSNQQKKEFSSRLLWEEKIGKNAYLPLLKLKKTAVKSGKRVFTARIDAYLKVGFIYTDVERNEYEKILAWQRENNLRVIYPLIADNEYTFDKTDANFWYKTTSRGDPIKIENGEITPIEYGENFALEDNYLLDENGRPVYYLYAGGGNTQTAQYRIRVLYYNYYRYKNGFEPQYLFGTDSQGYDLSLRLASGVRLSLAVALLVSIINLIIGTLYGAVEGYYGGGVDLTMERIADVLSGIPFIVVATLFQIHLAAKVGTIVSLLFAFVLTGWIGTARRVRTQFYRYKNQEYVLSARTLGAKDGRIIWKHIFPNAIGTIITSSVFVIPNVIFQESMLSFLGIVNLGGSTSTSLGTLLSEASSIWVNYPHLMIYPAIIISLLMICFNLFGNGLRDAFNPSLRGVED